MNYLTTILLEKGYKVYGYYCTFPNQNSEAKIQIKKLMETRTDLIYINQNKDFISFYALKDRNMNFSTMIISGITDYYIKDNDFKNPILYGLNEFNKPPTLISPRPSIKIAIKEIINNIEVIKIITNLHDDAMNIVLKKEDHNVILEAMFNNNITFEYDLTTNKLKL